MKANDARLGIRLSRAELAAINARAKASGHTVSDYVRIRCTEDRDGPRIVTDVDELRRLYVGLRKAGGNLNQVARELNSRHRPDEARGRLTEALEAVARASEDISRFISDARRSV